MKIEVLAAAMHQTDLSVYKRMNLSTDAVIVNQCDSLFALEDCIDGHNVRMYSYPERGVGRSRNKAVMHSSGDICIFADEDFVFYDNYADIVTAAFERFKDADAVLFNQPVVNAVRVLYKITKDKRMSIFDTTKFGLSSVAVKRESLLKYNVWFSLLFGGGARYGSGEDTLFLYSMLKKGMNVYLCKDAVSCTDTSSSTWFEGYTDKFFADKGALYAAMLGRRAYISVAVSSWRWYKRLGGERSFREILALMQHGIKEFLD